MGKTVFIDLFLLLLLQITALFLAAIILMRESDSVERPEVYNEFIIRYSWVNPEPPQGTIDGRGSDIDGWIQRDFDKSTLCMFQRREVDVFTLQNDNTGSKYGEVDGQRLAQAAETITINTIKPGVYEFSLVGYRVPAYCSPADVEIVIQKVNNPYEVIYKGNVQVKDKAEVPIIYFEVNDKGHVENVSTDSETLNKLWRH